jgi:hypothetical protein
VLTIENPGGPSSLLQQQVKQEQQAAKQPENIQEVIS